MPLGGPRTAQPPPRAPSDRHERGLAHDHVDSAANKLRNPHGSKNPRDHGAAGPYRQPRGPLRHHVPLESTTSGRPLSRHWSPGRRRRGLTPVAIGEAGGECGQPEPGDRACFALVADCDGLGRRVRELPHVSVGYPARRRPSKNRRASASLNSSPYTAPGRRGASITAPSASRPTSNGVKPVSVIKPETTALAASSSPHRNMTTRSGPVRPAAAA